MTIRDLIKMDVDVDIYNDVTDEVAPAFCGALELTEHGAKEFGDVLDIECDFSESENFCTLLIDNHEDWEALWYKALSFFWSAAGYCADTDWNKWFKETPV